MGESYNERIESENPLITPRELRELIPLSKKAAEVMQSSREECRSAIAGFDKRLLIITGPCSIHEKKSTVEYAEKLAEFQKKVSKTMIVMMRVYFEKPRTATGWKGLINDPDLNNTFQMEKGLKLAREILLEINEMGVACATEFLDPITPAYISDLISWCAIGARTTESQTHRQMASGLSMPVGFKNSTSGDVKVAINAMLSAATKHRFLGINQEGRVQILSAKGNRDTHIILRGGTKVANCTISDIRQTIQLINEPGLNRKIMIDCSHGNVSENYIGQLNVFNELLPYYIKNPDEILGIMFESFLYPGKQPFGKDLRYGVSITDPCIGWAETESILLEGDRRIKDALFKVVKSP